MRRLLPLCLALVGCTNIVPPPRDSAYEHRLPVGSQLLSFHWPREVMPLRIHLMAGSPLTEHTQIAIDRWRAALNYEEFQAILVDDSTTADILIRFGPPQYDQSGAPEPFPAFRLPRRAPQCTGETQLDIDVATLTLHLPVRIYVWPNGVVSPSNPAPTPLVTCYRLTTTHELGHALGILQHSSDLGDIMYRDPQVDQLSIADRETMELVFHSLPTLRLEWASPTRSDAVLPHERAGSPSHRQ